MPRVKRYLHKPGYYIKTRVGNLYTTYQVTQEGREWLERLGLRRGGEISQGDLELMKSHGFLFTHGGEGGLAETTESKSSGQKARRARGAWAEARETGRSVGSIVLPPFVDDDPPPPPFSWVRLGEATPEPISGGVVVPCAIVLILSVIVLLILYSKQICLILALFLPCGLISMFAAKLKRRSIAEGFFLGQLLGPIGLIIQVFLPECDEGERENVADEQIVNNED